MNTIPFWDTAATQPARGLGIVPDAPFIAPGIITALPESPNEPWPAELSQWDTIEMEGMRAPGIARLEGGGRGKRISSQVFPGASGASYTYLGIDPVEFFIKITIWTPKQWAWLQQFIALIAPPPTAVQNPKSVKVYHPALALINLYDICVIRVGQFHVDDYQRGSIDIHCTEFFPFVAIKGGPVESTTEITNLPDGRVQLEAKPPDGNIILNSIGVAPTPP